uniref:Uncharacterized protein n=1 Tax=Panagrolaimus sp. ES5 TaxID=591445 RepID=A0AC34GXV5_9BILA
MAMLSRGRKVIDQAFPGILIRPIHSKYSDTVIDNRQAVHSVNQRAGRVGKNGPGRVIHLLTKEEVSFIQRQPVDNSTRGNEYENAALFHVAEGCQINKLDEYI